MLVGSMPRVPALASAATAVRASVFAELQQKIDERARRGGSLIPLQIGDTHLAPPEGGRLGDVLGDAVDPELYRYGAVTGLATLRDLFAEQVRERGLPWVVGAKHLLVGAGATHALFCAAKVLLDPGDDVLLFAPYWPLAPGVLRAAGARPVEVPMSSRLYAEPRLDVRAALEAALTPHTTALYLITPNNPDGKVLSRENLEIVADFARHHGLWVFADEVYADFVFDGAHTSIASLEGMAERTVTAHSFSKSHALAGARVGFVVAPEAVIAAARRISTHTIYNVPVVSQRAALGALRSGAAWLAGARARYGKARDLAAARLSVPGVRFGRAEGGAYLFADFTEKLDGRPLRALLESAIDHGVLLAPGDAFGAGFERHARLCYTGVDEPQLEEGLARLVAAMEALA